MEATEEAKAIAARIKTIAQDLEGSSIGMVGIPAVEAALNLLEGAGSVLYDWGERNE